MINTSNAFKERAKILGELRTTLNDALHLVDGLPISVAPIEEKAGRSASVESVLIRALISERRRRDDFFPTNLFADPAWDMLLELYAACLEQHRVTTSSLCRSAAVPPTTALRWIGTLEQQGLITKQGDRLDARRVFIELSAKGRSMMESYFQAKKSGKQDPRQDTRGAA